MQSIFTLYAPSNKVHEIIHDHNIVGLFSHVEGLPNAVCEGMSAGKTIISSNVSDVKNLLSQQPEFIFEPNNPRQLADILKKLINNYSQKDLEKIGLKNRSRAEKLFDKNKIYQSYLNSIKL